MKVSLNLAQAYSNVNLKPNGIDNLVQKIGAQLGAIEEVIETGPKYEGVVVVKVVSCEKHPNADKLSICFIDDGGVVQNVDRNADGHVQVVCGAQNVRAGQTVAWLPPGATVPSTYDKEPFVLGARELRGMISNGMLASPSELAIGDSHDGILEIDVQEIGEDQAKPGTPFKQLYGLDDIIIDIENKMFTHRPDCFGVLGVAREIAGIQQQAFHSPDWYLKLRGDVYEDADGSFPVGIKNELPVLVPRFILVSIKDIQIKPSPVWLQAALNRVGIKSINNVVDITNYISYVTGQPLHAYDYDKVQQLDPQADSYQNQPVCLVIRHPQPGEKIKLLNGKLIEPRPEAIMIATEKQAIGIGGVMGGTTTEVDDHTKNIILESANFDMYSIRRTSMVHGLFTDAVTRFNKGQSPLQNDRVISQAVAMVRELAGGSVASVNDDIHLDENIIASDSQLKNAISVRAEFINARLGLKLSNDEISLLLKNVEFNIEITDEQLIIKPPFWRTDIAIPEDIVEEVGRLYGFEKLPLELPKRTITPTKPDIKLVLKQKLRQTLANFGANEVLTYSFVHGNLIKNAGQNKDLAFKLSNALSPELQYYRMSLTPSLLSQVHPNIKSGHNSFTLFEINKTHINLHKDDDKGVPKELEMVTLVTASKSATGSAYYQARAYLDQLAESLGVKLRYEQVPKSLDYAVTASFEPARSALALVEGSDNLLLGIVGEYKQSVTKALKLPAYCAGFEIGLEAIMTIINQQSKYTPLSRYPSVSQDICLEIDQSISYGDLTAKLEVALQSSSQTGQTIGWKPIDIYQSDNSDKKRITYRLTITSYSQTLTEDVASAILNQAAAALQESVGATRI